MKQHKNICSDYFKDGTRKQKMQWKLCTRINCPSVTHEQFNLLYYQWKNVSKCRISLKSACRYFRFFQSLVSDIKRFLQIDNVIYGKYKCTVLNIQIRRENQTLNISEMAKLLSPRSVNRFLYSIFKDCHLFFSISAIPDWNQNFMNFYDFFVV